MGLKCSVLGHAYGETSIERDREERGSEVVITIRELETCDRCGDTRVVTENKEVTTIETPDGEPDVTAADAMAAMDAESPDVVGSAGGSTDAESAAGSATATGTGTAADAGSDEGEPLVDDAEGGAAVTDDSVDSPSPDAVEDQGAEILDADEGTSEDEAVDDELADPTIENETDSSGDTTDGEDAVILDDESSEESEAAGGATEDSASEDARGHTIDGDEGGHFDSPDGEADDDPLGEWPEETLRDTDEDWTPSEEITGTVGDVDPDANVDRELSTNAAVTVPEGEFHCEGCGYETPVEASSLRAGDYCPECHSETLVHRPEE